MTGWVAVFGPFVPVVHGLDSKIVRSGPFFFPREAWKPHDAEPEKEGVMPREQINYPNSVAVVVDVKGNELEYQEGAAVPPGYSVHPDPALHVHWQQALDFAPGHVQVSVEMAAGHFKARAAHLDDSVKSTSIFTPALSRAEINKLIRVLRSARDKAYGRDE